MIIKDDIENGMKISIYDAVEELSNNCVEGTK